ncbi:MAG: alpha/beta fold hydrolase [Saprospiraceae bacterium]|nr:alpha/beta fold hydrolase [Saprospiraceae bacterium]
MILTTFLIIFFIIGIVLYLEFGLPYKPISPSRKREKVKPSDFGLHFQPFRVYGARAAILRGYFIRALTVEAKATIIVLHGIGSAKEVYFPFASWLAQQGFNIVVYDQRAHGRSGGRYCTFGYLEKKDVSKVINKTLRRFSKLPIGIHGTSMGGAVAIQALAIEKRLKFGIIESTFNTLENVIEEYGRDMLKFRSRWLVRRILSRSAKIAQFRPFDVKPVEFCRQIEQPILMIHGDVDEKIPIQFHRDNFSALKTTDKEFFVVNGAGHDNVSETGGTVYYQKILTFLNRCVSLIQTEQNTPPQ